MTQLFRFLFSTLLFTGCVGGAVVFDVDGGPRDDAPSAGLPLCAAPPASNVGWVPPFAMQPPPAIRMEPDADLAGLVTVSSVERIDGVLTLGLVDGETSRTIAIEDAMWDPNVEVGDEVVATTTRAGWPIVGQLGSLILRRVEGELVAAYVRSSPGFDLGPHLHVTASRELDCFLPTGGQCGRGIHEYRLLVGEARAAQGESVTAYTPEGPIEIFVGMIANDGYVPPGTDVCAIGYIGGVVVDARPAP